MMRFSKRRCEDEPPDQIQDVKSNDNRNRGVKYTVGNLHRILLWLGSILYRSGSLMCTGGGISSRWLHLVLGIGEYERKNGEGTRKIL
jgi:hypothetical protein